MWYVLGGQRLRAACPCLHPNNRHMRILALEPYLGGSHQAFLEGWSSRSRHEWTVLGLPAYKWKWRMRHAPITFAREVNQRLRAGESWDLLFASDMLHLPEFLGLSAEALQQLPRVVYFHENQLTYPVREQRERDLHFGFSNVVTALAADAVWFNSAFHRTAFLSATEELFARMPDQVPDWVVPEVASKSTVQPPGVASLQPASAREPGPLRIVWAARWEHDKGPQTFFAAMRLLVERDVDFQVSVLGESFRQVPAVFEEAPSWLGNRIGGWGFLSRCDYEQTLRDADVFVSTAEHEFFGLAAVEAALAGALPLLPERLAYPEVFGLAESPEAASLFYDGTAEQVAARLETLATAPEGIAPPPFLRQRLQPFAWEQAAERLDRGLEKLASGSAS